MSDFLRWLLFDDDPLLRLPPAFWLGIFGTVCVLAGWLVAP